MGKREYGELELSVLSLLRKKKEASVREIFIEHNDVAYTTILTVMKRLFEKGVLKRRKDKRCFVYEYHGQNLGYVKRFTDKLKERFFKGSAEEMVCYFIDTLDLTQEELLKIEKYLKEKK